MPDALSERINLPVSKGLIRSIDDWRRLQPDIPTRAAAARMLIEHGLAAERAARMAQKPEPAPRKR